MKQRKQKPIIQFQRHREIGSVLRCINDRLVRLQTEMSNSRLHGRHHKIVFALYKAQQKLSEVRSELENIMFSDHPSQAATSTYYGPPDKPVTRGNPVSLNEFKRRLKLLAGDKPPPGNGEPPPF